MISKHFRHNLNTRMIITLCILCTLTAACILLQINQHNERHVHTLSHHDRLTVAPTPTRPPARVQVRPQPAQQHIIISQQKPKSTPPRAAVAQPDVHPPSTEDGLAPIITSLPTKEPVVFLGIDDGAYKSPDELQMMNDHHIKASLYLSRLFIQENPGFFTDFLKSGNLIENHSLNHYIRTAEIDSYELQKQEICGMADYQQAHYGRRPIFFRPPGGAYSVAMRKAAADCGMRAIVTWIAKANGGSMQYQVGDHLRPGDVVLMHFRPEFRQDMQAFLDAMNAAHLHTELLENWL